MKQLCERIDCDCCLERFIYVTKEYTPHGRYFAQVPTNCWVRIGEMYICGYCVYVANRLKWLGAVGTQNQLMQLLELNEITRDTVKSIGGKLTMLTQPEYSGDTALVTFGMLETEEKQ